MKSPSYDYAADDLADMDMADQMAPAPPKPVAEESASPPPPRKSPAPHPLDIPEAALYGWLASKARTIDGPLAWVYCSLMTIFAAQGVNLHDNSSEVRPTVYTVLVGKPQDGKSRVQDRCLRSLNLAGVSVRTTTPASERGLLKMFQPPKNTEPQALRSHLLILDEFRLLLSKMNIQGSALAPLLCTLWYHDEAGVADKQGCVEIEARLNLLGALACEDPDHFRSQFGAETLQGLFSRLIIVPGPPDYRFNNRWRPSPDLRKPKLVQVPAHCFDAVEAWRDESPSTRKRIGEIALRVALITACANLDDEVTPAGMQTALRFCEWQERVRAVYSPSEATTSDAAITVAILDALKEHADQHGPLRYVRFRELAQRKNWHRKWGRAVTAAKESLIRDGAVEAEYEFNEKTEEFIYTRPTGRVRLPMEEEQ